VVLDLHRRGGVDRARAAPLAASGDGTVLGIDYKDLSSGARQFIGTYELSYPNLRDIDGRSRRPTAPTRYRRPSC